MPDITKLLRSLLLVLLLFAAACREEATPTVVPTVDTSAGEPTVVTTEATEGAPTVTSQASQENGEPGTPPESTASESAQRPQAVPEPALFDVTWDDRGPFLANLVDVSEAALGELQGASVYHMDLELSTDLLRLAGQQEVRYTNREDVALNEIYFRLFPNLADGRTTIESVMVNGHSVEPSFELRDSAVRIPLDPALPPGEAVVVALDFTVEIPSQGGGNYNTFVFTEEILALAHFYPMIAVYDDEGWNLEIAPESGDVVYADSSFYLVRLLAPGDLQVAASGVDIEGGSSGDQQQITFAAGPARDFYFAASAGFEVVTQEVDGTVVNSYTFPAVRAASEDAVVHTIDAIESFNERIGPYPYTELDLVSTPTLALGVEYPGILAINKDLYDRSEDAEYPPIWLESTVAHEVGHQWFYNVVGNDQLDEPWLDESLVQYVTMLYFRDVHGPADAAGFRQSLVQRWNAVDQEDIPVGMPVEAYEGAEYSAIVYGRGPLFFEELSGVMGEETFNTFLQEYYQTFRWDIATPAGLQSLAEEHCQCELDALFNEWIYGQE